MKKHPISEIDDSLGEKAIFEKAEALDNYLHVKLGAVWKAIKSNIEYLPANAAASKNLCHFFLVATSAVKLAHHPHQYNVFTAENLAKPFKTTLLFSRSLGPISISLLYAHPSIEIDISTAWHPSWKDETLSPLEASITSVSEKVINALEIIKCTSAISLGMISALCSEICILRPRGLIGAGSSISMTSKIVPGLIYITPSPVLMTAESIVHEVAHLWLSRHEAGRDMYSDPNRIVSSPLRPDPRPLSGLTHQVWVLSNLVPFYSSLLNLTIPVVLQNKSKIEKRLAQHEADLKSGLQTLNDHASGLTAEGQEFLSRINFTSS